MSLEMTASSKVQGYIRVPVSNNKDDVEEADIFNEGNYFSFGCLGGRRKKDGLVWKQLIAIASCMTLLVVIALSKQIGETKTTKIMTSDSSLIAHDPKQIQIANYVNGNETLLLNIHITHHAGTFLCHYMRLAVPTPGFACMGPGDEDWPPNVSPQHNIVSYNQTESYVSLFRPYFHYMSWEFSGWGNLHTTNWEYEKLISMIVMRDPIERFLAGGKCGRFHEDLPADPTNETQDIYWEYANDECSNNYALKVLADKAGYVMGSNTTAAALESAKTLLNRFTFVLDQACLSESVITLGDVLHLNITEASLNTGSSFHHLHPSTRERIGNDTLYDFLQDRFRRDIELYEWSKTISIIKCNVTN